MRSESYIIFIQIEKVCSLPHSPLGLDSTVGAAIESKDGVLSSTPPRANFFYVMGNQISGKKFVFNQNLKHNGYILVSILC